MANTEAPTHTGSHESGLLYARTFSATKRHLQKPEDTAKTLCGGRIMLAEIYTNDDGDPVQVPLETLFMEINEPRPMCGRCAKSVAKRPQTVAPDAAAPPAPKASTPAESTAPGIKVPVGGTPEEYAAAHLAGGNFLSISSEVSRWGDRRITGICGHDPRESRDWLLGLVENRVR